MEPILTRVYQVRAYESDFTGKAHPLTLLNYMQEIAGEHAANLGVSLKSLLEKGLTWMLVRYQIRFLHYPTWGEAVTVRTWPSGRQGLYALREFELSNASNEVMALGTSGWILFHLEKKRPVRLEKNLPDFPHQERRMIADDFQSLPALSAVDTEFSFQARMQDLDVNKHVNNVVYIGWALETVPRPILENYRLAELQVEFRGEAHWGDPVVAQIQSQPDRKSPVFLHRLLNATGEKEFTRLVTTWRKF